MKWYFASRTRHRPFVKSIVKELGKNGQSVTYDWTILKFRKSYQRNTDKCKKIAKDISKAIDKTEVFVLISDPEGTDMFIELGIAIARWMKNKKPRIYIVGKYNKRSLMHFHPAIIHANSLEEVAGKESLNIKPINIKLKV